MSQAKQARYKVIIVEFDSHDVNSVEVTKAIIQDDELDKHIKSTLKGYSPRTGLLLPCDKGSFEAGSIGDKRYMISVINM